MKFTTMPVALAICVAAFSIQGCSLSSSTSSVVSSTLQLEKSASASFAAFEESEQMMSDVGSISNSESIVITKDDGKSISYKIASSLDAGGSTITFRFDDLGAGKSTILAEIDVPPVARGKQYLSEHKIRNVLDKSLKEFAAALNKDESVASALRQINSTILTVAIVTNSTNDKDDMQLVIDMMDSGEGGETSLASSEFTQSDVSDSAITGKPSMQLDEGNNSDWDDSEEPGDFTDTEGY